MPTVFPCYSAADRELVQQLAAFLERSASVEVLLEEGELRPGEDLVSKVEKGLTSDAVLALLSPDSVPERWILQRWQSVFWHQAAEVHTPVATLLCRDAKFPDLLRRKHFFDFRSDRLEAFRSVKRWLMNLRPAAQPPVFQPGRVTGFAGREPELETLATLLADLPGVVVLAHPEPCGKTALALEFARRSRQDFAATFWLTCADRTLPALAGDLAAQAGLRLDRDLESNLSELSRFCSHHRCLLVLDDVQDGQAAALAPRGKTSVLVTTRRAGVEQSLSATAAPLAASSDTSFAGLDRALANLTDTDRDLLSAMAACAPSGFRVDFAARVAGLHAGQAQDIAATFVLRGWIVELDRNGPRFSIPAPVRDVAAGFAGDDFRARHARAAAEWFEARIEPDAPDLTPEWPQLRHALPWALAGDWKLACTLARRGVTWARAQDRLAEAFEILRAWAAAAEPRGDRRALEDGAWEQIWILEYWGRYTEARELEHLRQERYADQLSLAFPEAGELSL